MGRSLTEIALVEYGVKTNCDGKQINVCGLCRNNGIVETNPTTPAGLQVSLKTYCICPNGRKMKRMKCKID